MCVIIVSPLYSWNSKDGRYMAHHCIPQRLSHDRYTFHIFSVKQMKTCMLMHTAHITQRLAVKISYSWEAALSMNFKRIFCIFQISFNMNYWHTQKKKKVYLPKGCSKYLLVLKILATPASVKTHVSAHCFSAVSLEWWMRILPPPDSIFSLSAVVEDSRTRSSRWKRTWIFIKMHIKSIDSTA